MTTEPLIIHLAGSAGEGTPLPLGLTGLPTEIEGKPVFYRRKEICRVVREPHRGRKNPDGSPFIVDIPATRLDLWADVFKRRLTKGIKPFLYPRHVNIDRGEQADARETQGYAIGVDREGGKLYGTLQLIGEDALKCAAANDVSVTVTGDALDPEFIHHLAFTPNPQVTGMGGYTALVASADGTSVEMPVFVLSDCGTGAGGFQPGNTCAAGGDGGTATETGDSILGKNAISTKDPQTMSPTQINAEFEKLRKLSSRMTDRFIAEGRGSERPSDRVGKTDPLTVANNRIDDRINKLRREAEARTGSDRLPMQTDRMFGRRKKELSLSGDIPMTEQQLDSIRELIGADDLTDETAIPLLLEWGTKRKKDGESVTALSADVTRLTAELATANEAKQQATLALSAAQPKQYDELSLSLIGESFATKREQAIASGAISEAGMKMIDALLLPDGKPSPVALALSGDGTAARPLYARLCEIIAGNPGVKTGNAVTRAMPALRLDATDTDPAKTQETARAEGAEWQKKQAEARGLAVA